MKVNIVSELFFRFYSAATVGEENKTTNESPKEFSVPLSNAFVIHPSDHPGLVLVEKLLEGDNYDLLPPPQPSPFQSPGSSTR